jgi:hypothetical protein
MFRAVSGERPDLLENGKKLQPKPVQSVQTRRTDGIIAIKIN